MDKIPGWVWIVVVIVGLYLVIGKLTSSANSVIRQVGDTKARTAQSFANTGIGVFSALGQTIGCGAASGLGALDLADQRAPLLLERARGVRHGSRSYSAR